MIYFSDDFNFNPANFPALFAWLKKGRHSFDFDRQAPALKKRWGDYQNDFRPADRIEAGEIVAETCLGFNLYDIYEPELLFACAASPLWPQLEPPAEKDELVRLLYPLFPELFNLCRSAARHWLNHWRRHLPGRVKAGISFGGSLIYAQAFARVLAAEGLDSLMVEHFFTGHDFYFEKRVEPLPNDSILKNNDYCRELEMRGLNPLTRHLKIQRARNKNVRQPAFKMPQNSGYALILGQVANDFSILSRSNPFKNSVGFYQKALDALLERSEMDIVIKTHPYEARKVKAGGRTTYALLQEYLERKPPALRGRVSLVDERSLAGLISRAAFALTLNSQAGLETLMQGRPLICFGRPFYGGKGFTHDLGGLDELGPAIRAGGISLSVGQFEKLGTFLDAAFEHLVGQGEEHKIGEVLGPASISGADSKSGVSAALQRCLGALGRAARALKARRPFTSK